jgi:hypothetical protein
LFVKVEHLKLEFCKRGERFCRNKRARVENQKTQRLEIAHRKLREKETTPTKNKHTVQALKKAMAPLVVMFELHDS